MYCTIIQILTERKIKIKLCRAIIIKQTRCNNYIRRKIKLNIIFRATIKVHWHSFVWWRAFLFGSRKGWRAGAVKDRVEQPAGSSSGLSRGARSRRNSVRRRRRPFGRAGARAGAGRRASLHCDAHGWRSLWIRRRKPELRVAAGEHWLRSHWRRTLALSFGPSRWGLRVGLGLVRLAHYLRDAHTSEPSGWLRWHLRCSSWCGKHLDILVRPTLLLHSQNALCCLRHCYLNNRSSSWRGVWSRAALVSQTYTVQLNSFVRAYGRKEFP